MNKKGYINPFEMVTVFILTVIIVVPISMFMASLYMRNGTLSIEINKPYLMDYEQSQLELEECKESKIPECTPVKCDCGKMGVLWGILGGIFYATGIGYWLYMQRQKDKKPPKKH